MIAGEKVAVVNNNNGERIETYVIRGGTRKRMHLSERSRRPEVRRGGRGHHHLVCPYGFRRSQTVRAVGGFSGYGDQPAGEIGRTCGNGEKAEPGGPVLFFVLFFPEGAFPVGGRLRMISRVLSEERPFLRGGKAPALSGFPVFPERRKTLFREKTPKNFIIPKKKRNFGPDFLRCQRVIIRAGQKN